MMVAAGVCLIAIGLAGLFFCPPVLMEKNGDLSDLSPLIQKLILYGLIFSIPIAGVGGCLMAYGENDEVRYTACMNDMKDRDYCDSKFFVTRPKNEIQENKGITVNGL